MSPVSLAAPNSSGTEPPKLKAPAHAADCHIHIYYPDYTKPANGAVADYRLLQKRIGYSRVVIVQPRGYATDNSVTLDAIKQLGIADARGIGVVRPSVTDAELKKMDEGGIRGIRFTTGSPETAVVSIDMIEPLAKRIAALGWHVQLNMEPEQIVDSAELLNRLPTPIVFDHMGKLGLTGIGHPSYKVIRGLVDKGRAWFKLSGAFMNTQIGPPTYGHATEAAKTFVKAAPERLVWGSDWPHPGAKVKPDDAMLLDLLLDWVPDEATRNRILVTNPIALYGFGK